jgi:hypothetical protein
LQTTAIVKHVKNPGPTSRCHNEVEKKRFEDWFPEADEFCFAGDAGISDEEEEDEVELPYLMKKPKTKSSKKKMKERVYFDPSIPNSHLLLCKSLCFDSVYQFREALRDFHIRTLRSFHYHRNTPTRIIVWCSQREHGCEFYMCASRIAHERTFCIKKCNMEHTCPASAENTKVTTKWLSKAVEQLSLLLEQILEHLWIHLLKTAKSSFQLMYQRVWPIGQGERLLRLYKVTRRSSTID